MSAKRPNISAMAAKLSVLILFAALVYADYAILMQMGE